MPLSTSSSLSLTLRADSQVSVDILTKEAGVFSQIRGDLLRVIALGHGIDLVPIRPEDVLVAAAEVGMYLARQKCILGYIRLSRVVVERKKEEPCDADDDEEEG